MVGDPCNKTGNYRGAAHLICNPNAGQSCSNYLPFASLNLNMYVAHLFLIELKKQKTMDLRLPLMIKLNRTKPELLLVV